MKKLLIFDLDGTLADTLPTLTESMNSVLAEFSYPLVDNDHICRSLGNGMEQLCRRCVPSEFHDEPSVYLPFLARYKEQYAKNYLNIDEPYAGLAEAIAELKRRGYTIATLSNKPHRYTVDIVEKLFGKGYFAEIRGMIDGVPIKPDPTSFLDIVGKLGFTPENAVMIGDLPADVNAAVSAGANCIGALWGYSTRETLKENGATLFAAKPTDILTII